MCVQSSSVQRVLQFTPFNVVCYVLHRSVSQVIHGQQLFFLRQSLQSSQWQSQGLRRHLAWTSRKVRSSNPFTHQACDFKPASTPIHVVAHHKFWKADLPTKPRGRLTVSHTKIGNTCSGNDPSAGSPTDTLLRLLLPLNNQVWRSSVSLKNLAASRPPSKSLT